MKTKEMPAVAHGFNQYLQSKNLAKSTRDYYVLKVEQFKKWYQSEILVVSEVELTNTTKADIINYLTHLKNKTNQGNITRRNALISLNHYFTYLLQTKQIATNPTTLIKIRGAKKKTLYTIYTQEKLTQLADDYHHNYIRNFNADHSIKTRKKQSLLSKERNYCMLTLLIYQGIKTNELQKIQVNDLDIIKATIKITGSKKSNTRTLPLNASQMGTLINYTQNIRPQFFEYCLESNQLFLPLPPLSQKMTASTYILDTVKRLAKQLRTLDHTFTNFYQIRASVITHWIKTDGLRKAQYLAGHRNISSTEEYKINDLESLIDDIAKFHPY